MRRLTVALLAGLIFATSAWAIETKDFRYERPLSAGGQKPISFEPDRRMYGHAQIGFSDLRIIDGSGQQVPWRMLPQPKAPRPVAVRVLNAGRQRDGAVALLDLGPRRKVRDRLELDIPDTSFVGRVRVSGTDDRRTFTHLSTSVVYDIQGAEGHARSTVVTFPPSDFRYLQLTARGVSRIDGATISGRGSSPSPTELPLTSEPRVETVGRATLILLDLEFPKVPVDEVRISAGTSQYNRPATVAGSNDGNVWEPLASARVYRLWYSSLSGSTRTPETSIRIDGRHRYLRLTIENGDDAPLQEIDVATLAFPRPVVVEGGRPRPLRLFYGDPSARPPVYDFARLPLPKSTTFALGALGPERPNELFEPPPDTRSFAARHSSVVTVALVIAAVAAAAAGGLALRRRA